MSARGLSQRDLGDRLGISGSAVAQWMGREGTFAQWWRLRAVAIALGVSADSILGLPEAPPLPTPIDPRVIHRLIDQLEKAAALNEKAAAEVRKLAENLPGADDE